MKTVQFHLPATPQISAILCTATLLIASGVNAATEHASQADKRSSEEYWAEFKQDSKQTWKDSKEAFKDGWIESKLETALILNKHLNALDIDINVDNNVATLGGVAHSDIEKELAENIALGIEGIDSVKNNMEVTAKPATTTNT